MEAYRERLAQRISIELQRKGEDHRDLAAALKVDPRTAERWTTGERSPQRHNRKPIADYLGVPIEELWPDLEVEEKRFRDQLDRIEARVDVIARGVAALLSQPERDLGPAHGELRQELLGESPTRAAPGDQDPQERSQGRKPA